MQVGSRERTRDALGGGQSGQAVWLLQRVDRHDDVLAVVSFARSGLLVGRSLACYLRKRSFQMIVVSHG
jgi:hypothetical protein